MIGELRKEAIMSLRMQLRRGVIALLFGLLVGSFAIGRAGHDDAVGVHGVGTVIRAVDSGADCDSSLRIEIASHVQLTIPCEASCAPMRNVLHTLHVPAATRQTRCAMVHTA